MMKEDIMTKVNIQDSHPRAHKTKLSSFMEVMPNSNTVVALNTRHELQEEVGDSSHSVLEKILVS
jgi:hypothetical protein